MPKPGSYFSPTVLGAAAAEAKVLSALEDPSWPRKPLDIIRAGGMWTKGDRAAWEQAILAEDGVTQQRLLGRPVARMAPGVVAAKRRERMGQAMDFRTEIERKSRGVWAS